MELEGGQGRGESHEKIETTVKNNLTIARGEWGGDSEERGLQELL